MIYAWTLTLVYVGWCYGGYHGDAVHVETAALDRNCRRACAEIYTGHQFLSEGGEEARVRVKCRRGPDGPRLVVSRGCQERASPEVAVAPGVLHVSGVRDDDGDEGYVSSRASRQKWDAEMRTTRRVFARREKCKVTRDRRRLFCRSEIMDAAISENFSTGQRGKF